YSEPRDAQLARSRLAREFEAGSRPWEVEVGEGPAGEHVSGLLDALGEALVVTGPVRSGALGPAVLGSTIDRLLRRPGTTLLMVNERVHRPYRRLLLASDFSDACAIALQRARALFPGA